MSSTAAKASGNEIPQGMKLCSACKQTLEFACFYADKTSKTGVSSRCRACVKDTTAKWKVENRDRVNDAVRRYNASNLEKRRESERRSFYKHIDKRRAKQRQWAANNKHLKAASVMRRHCKKLNATPSWLTNEHFERITWFYEEARRLTTETGIKHQVDHIHPLQGKNFSGLHVPWNLRVITASENAAKMNRIPRGEEHLFFT